ncbi:MAG: SsrA-binding protein SmpB, partial [Eubacteriales bacterium]|nr:SsrA-binding protein SmpB [Eubacteriales bacterium]
MDKKKTASALIAENRRARHDYQILEDYEAGIELKGTEVKSLRQNHSSLADAYAYVKGGEVFIAGWHIAPYEQGNRYNVDPLRDRRLLLHRREIIRIEQKIQRQGLTLIPLKAYFSRSRVKIKLGLAQGKKSYDKREDLKKRDIERAMRQSVKR